MSKDYTANKSESGLENRPLAIQDIWEKANGLVDLCPKWHLPLNVGTEREEDGRKEGDSYPPLSRDK